MTTRPHILRCEQARAMWEGRMTAVCCPLKVQPKLLKNATAFYRPHPHADPYMWHSLHGGYIHCIVRAPFAPGDVLVCKEEWGTWMTAPFLPGKLGGTVSRDPDDWIYRADNEQDWQHMLSDRHLLHAYNADRAKRNGNYIVRSAANQPRWASRMTAIVRDVSVFQLTDINLARTYALGIEQPDEVRLPITPAAEEALTDMGLFPQCDPFEMLKREWNQQHNSPHDWDSNPWCAYATLDVRKCNVDAMEAAE